MAEDKRIRITADISPLQQLREEAVSLYRDMDEAASRNSDTTEKNLRQLREQLSLMKDRNELEQLLIDLKKQAASIQEPSVINPTDKPTFDKETNSLSWDLSKPEESSEEETEEPKKGKGKGKKKKPSVSQEEVEPIINEEQASVEWDLKRPEREIVEAPEKITIKETQKELLTEINRHVENIDNSITNVDNSVTNDDSSVENVDNSTSNVDNSKREEDRSENIRREERNIVNNQENVTNNIRNENVIENVRNIDRNVENIQSNTEVLKEKDPVEGKPEYEIPRTDVNQKPQENENTDRREYRVEKEEDERSVVFSDENIIRAINSLADVMASSNREFREDIQKLAKSYAETDSKKSNITRYLETLSADLSLIAENVDDIATEIVDLGITGRRGSGSQPPSGGGNTDIDLFGNFGKGGVAGGLTGLLGGVAALFSVNQIKNLLAERSFRNQEASLRSEYQGTVETAANYTRVQAANEADAYRWIPFIGDVIARSIELPANIAADKMAATVEKYFAAEDRTTLYAQTFGGSTNEAMRISGREGRYAADALGMDQASYLQRRTELTRAAGGRFPGGTEFDPTAARESQSLLAAERLYGLSSGSVNKLQGSLRFGDENQSYGGSAIIREFERAMSRLQMPFSEIASTMEESLDTFNKQADSILSKAGEFDAGRIAAIMSGVREATGARGRQLERLQQGFSGSNISQDEVTQALLLRTLQKTDPNVRTYSEAMEKLEGVQSGNANPEFMRDFLMQLQGLTQNNEQFINVLKGVFPNLSWNDLRSQFAEGDPSEVINRIFDKIMDNLSEIRETPRGAYEPSEARQTVGSGARIRASDTNRQIGEGGESLMEVLKSIERGVINIDGKLGQDWKNFIDSNKDLGKAFLSGITGKEPLDQAASKAQFAILQSFVNWTRITNRIFTTEER